MAGDDTITGEDPPEIARWSLPEAKLCHEGGAAPDNLRVLPVHGDSMAPLVGGSERLIVNVSRRRPATGELAVLWDGLGLVVKRLEAVPGSDPAELRLISANPAYAPYAVPAQDVHMVGKVVWVLRKA